MINVTVRDQQGREVPTANQFIQFTLQGDAKFIGVGNGDPSSHEPDQYANGQWRRRLFNGKCQLILQSGRSAGQLRVTGFGAGAASRSGYFAGWRIKGTGYFGK